MKLAVEILFYTGEISRSHGEEHKDDNSGMLRHVVW
jgi:hypothetical protein